jgi:O-antigen/teichoic acid export membrane protein
LIEQGRKEKLSLIIKWITPFALIILLMAMHYRLDGFLLERLRPDGAWQAGVYATAYRLLDAGNMIGYLTASFLFPFIARNNKDNKLIETVISRLQHALMLIAIGTSCFAFVFAPWIQEVLYHTTDPYNNKVIQLCLAVLPAYYLIHIYGSALTATSNFRLFITILLVSFILNVCLNCWLIPEDGALGSCIAALVSQYSCGLACYLAVTKKLSFSRSIMPFAVYIIGAAFLFLSFSLLKTNIHPVWIILAAMVLLFVILATSQVKILKRLFSSFIQ